VVKELAVVDDLALEVTDLVLDASPVPNVPILRDGVEEEIDGCVDPVGRKRRFEPVIDLGDHVVFA
jgi:hypothetical protein